MNNFYKLFKPLNPIEFDGERTSEYNLKKKYLNFLKLLFTSNVSLKYLLILFLQCLKGTTVLILVILYSPLATVLYFLNFRFLHINTHQIGAYIQEIDTLIKNNILQKNKKKIVFLCPKFLLINNFVHKLYPKKELIYFENIVIYFLLYPLMHTNFLKLSHWDYETTNPISKFNQLHLKYLNKKKRHNVKLRKLVHENYLLSRFAEKYKIRDLKKIIIIQVRDKDFYSGSTAITRNSDIKKLKKTIKYLIKKNYFVIRYVSLKRNKLIVKNSKYIELSIKNEKDKFLQYLLCKRCRLVICYQGGISSYNQ